MNPKTQEALIHSIFSRTGVTSNPAAGTTAVASVAAVPKTRYTIDTVIASQRNKTAANYTATLSLRDSSIAGTLLAQWEFSTAADGAERLAEGKLGVPGLVNSGVFAVWDPPAASVVQKVTIVAYRETSS